MMLQAMETGKVHLLPGLFAERAEVNRAYLMELENQGLLQNFYLEAGIIMPGLQVVEDPETTKMSRMIAVKNKKMQSILDTKCKVNYTLLAKLAMQKKREGFLMKNRIKELRKENKLSQSELADIVGTTRQTITSIEVGKYTASLGLAYKIAHHFNLTIEEVFDFSDIENEE